ncbi:hypothetical protein HOY82DRAFT_483866 [Tuber indicum]|nr:hypothetical protein HOY82DRAFT_483866 [Tuber indicum]
MSTPTTRIDVISLLSSSPGALEQSRKRSRPATPEIDTLAPSKSTSEPPVTPIIETLKSKNVGKSALREHLGSLSKGRLAKMILETAYPQPEPAEGILHCVYCHEAYNPKTGNYDRSIEH